MRFVDRKDAGRRLAALLLAYQEEEPIVLGLPRGGVVVASEVARALGAPLDVWIVREVGAPSSPRLWGRTVILVDDGLATGSTVRAAIEALRAAQPRKLVLAVPVAADHSVEALQSLVDDLVCVHVTHSMSAIGNWYDDFPQVAEEQEEQEVSILAGEVRLKGALRLPPDSRGLVLFAHGSGSSRFCPRDRRVAQLLQEQGLATLLFDLLTPEEEALDQQTAELRFNLPLLTRRLLQVTDWTGTLPALEELPLGYFGSNTGAAAAVMAAAERPSRVRAIVSRGGRPDLARDSLPRLRTPVLFIVGGEDHPVILLNLRACELLSAPQAFMVVPGATHLFEEPGALDAVARLGGEWFLLYLGRPILARDEEEDFQPSSDHGWA